MTTQRMEEQAQYHRCVVYQAEKKAINASSDEERFNILEQVIPNFIALQELEGALASPCPW